MQIIVEATETVRSHFSVLCVLYFSLIFVCVAIWGAVRRFLLQHGRCSKIELDPYKRKSHKYFFGARTKYIAPIKIQRDKEAIHPMNYEDVSGLLSTLGGLTGAVFNVGGLVVALVAILTQIQLQDRVRQEVEKAKQAVEDTFNNELRVEYEKRIQEQVEGMLAFFQATTGLPMAVTGRRNRNLA